VACRLFAGRHGILDLSDLEGKIRSDNQHFGITRLVCLENTSNAGGGRVYPLENIERIAGWAHRHGLKVHMDGARLFNAVVASGHSAKEICRDVDTVSICFSKGLGCPMGSILVGSAEDMRNARRIRKLFGGALRQAGVVAAAAQYAMENHVERLRIDHENAKAFADAICQVDGITLETPDVQTNIVFFKVDPELGNATQLSTRLREQGVRINASGPQRLRACTHLDVDRKGVLRAAEAIGSIVSEGFATAAGSKMGPWVRG
jgi:threonine aldolase